ncbi:MAG: hypothetical protein KAT29_07930 [Anaerolineales bacterium]|nr:hypothetical protein [Anaerolineales bacterium]
MPRLNPNMFLDDDYEIYADRHQHRLASYKPNHVAKKLEEEVLVIISDHSGGERINFTYKASRHEREWLQDALGSFFDEQWLDDVLRLIKGGKEANVYQCLGNETSGAELLAAKVYRPRKFRNLRNDYLYREGRTDLDSSGNQITNDGMLQAIRKRTTFGLQLLHESWIEYEYQALKKLHAAGADVPRPLARGHNAILMEYIGDPWQAASTLNRVRLKEDQTKVLFERILWNIDLMLGMSIIHGDLSAYNILYKANKLVLIDFPQVVAPLESQNAFEIFTRDVQRICEYFNRYGLRNQPEKIASQLWRAHGYRIQPDADPFYLDPDNEADRSYWSLSVIE